MKSITEKEIENFMHNIAWLRKKHNLSKKQMAQICHIGVPSLNKLENGIMPRKLRVDIVFAIYRYFGIHPTDQFKEMYKN